MADMGLGYGSEFQLLRFLGHHRNELDSLIKNEIGTEEPIEWKDFPHDESRISGDGEWKGIDVFQHFLAKDKYNDIKKKWKEYWPQSGTAMSWDGVFRIGDIWYFVEAKAHKEESYQKCKSISEESKNTIRSAFKDTQLWLGVNEEKKWIDTNCYQLANRLAFLYFCEQKCGIKAKLIYIGFINGYRRKKDEIHSSEEWMEIWKNELSSLGLDIENIQNKYIFFVHPECESDHNNQ